MVDQYIPVKQVGPGSQAEGPDELASDFKQLPEDMYTFRAPILPEPDEIQGIDAALARAREIVHALERYQVESSAVVFELDDLDPTNIDFFNQVLGEGEVSVQYQGEFRAICQESVLAGVWRIRYLNEAGETERDTVEVGKVPSLVTGATFNGAKTRIDIDAMEVPDTVYNSPSLLTELNDALAHRSPGDQPHVINLSLLPHTEEDLLFLSDQLGIGPTVILSRGYGNCRISSTQTEYVWWVQYFNSQETLILNTIELSELPDVACASPEDIEESAERLDEMLAVYQ